MNNYKLRKTGLIGKGTYSKVYTGEFLINKKKKCKVAFKISKSFTDIEDKVKQLFTLQKQISNWCPNIEYLLAIIKEPLKPVIRVLPIFGTKDLNKYIYDDIPSQQNLTILAYCVRVQMINALYFLHNELKIVHTDIKLDNIMVDINTNHIWLIDLDEFKYISNSRKDHWVQAVQYSHPNLMTDTLNWHPKYDNWSVSCVLYEIINREPLIKDEKFIIKGNKQDIIQWWHKTVTELYESKDLNLHLVGQDFRFLI
jgi:serine/threonine protein kinase